MESRERETGDENRMRMYVCKRKSIRYVYVPVCVCKMNGLVETEALKRVKTAKYS